MNNEKPILFSAPMVRAIWEGRKTQTRRIVKARGKIAVIQQSCGPMVLEDYDSEKESGFQLKPPYTVGMRLWVKETFALWDAFTTSSEGDLHIGKLPKPNPVSLPEWKKRLVYKADGLRVENWKWRSSLFMPRWASRITLEVTEVRVQRLQEISAKDAEAEGVQYGVAPCDTPGMVKPLFPISDPIRMKHYPNFTKEKITHEKMIRAEFASVWESINGEGSWEKNPWVWCISFKRIQ